MKKINLLSSTLALSFALTISASASTDGKLEPIEKMGFITTESCAEGGKFVDCYLEGYACGTDGCFETTEPGVQTKVNFVLFSHAEGATYKLDLSKINPADLDKAINVNDGSAIGEYDAKTNTIIATEVKGPPPPKKSFFKGCL